MNFDVVIVGGSFAGMSAAMQLARARRSVLVLDTGAPRNRYAASSHGFPGHDGMAPAEIQARLRSELMKYPSTAFLDVAAAGVRREGNWFHVALADGAQVKARRIVLAHGVRDMLPDIPGLQERWGTSVLHCPYCHGYELNGQPIGVVARSEMALHQAMLLPDWGQTTLFTQSLIEVGAQEREMLLSRGVEIETAPIEELLGPSPSLEGVRLADGRTVALAALFLAPQTEPSSDLWRQLGCAVSEGMTGPIIEVDAMQATTVPGVFAAGDLATSMPNATRAASAGVLAGVAAHRSLIFDPELKAAAHAA